MATLQEIKFDIINTLRPLFNDDDLLREDHVEFLVNTQRALWIRNSVKENSYIPQSFQQSLKCLELEQVSAIDCCIEVGSDCYVTRTKLQLPSFSDLHDRPAITRISSPIRNEKININYVKRNRAPYVGLGRFNKNLLYATYLDGYIYLVDGKCDTGKALKAITVEGVFNDPTEISKFSCDGQTCYDKLNDTYPMPDHLISFMKEHIIKQLSMSLNIPVDIENNASHDTPQQNASNQRQ